jgi:hypothetical protein
MNLITKMLSSVAVSSTKSLLGSGVKKTVKDILTKITQKSPEQIEKEVVEKVGFATSHFKLDKGQNVVFKSSPVFLHEWLVKSPVMKEKLIKDEENGVIYYQGEVITNANKMDIINEFVKATGAQSPALASHLDNALKLFDASDFIGKKFVLNLSGWDPDKPSIIDGFLEGCFGENFTPEPAYAKMLWRKWMIGTARRIIDPGSALDWALILQSKGGGIGKTALFRNLMPKPFEDRAGEIYCDVKDGRKFAENLIGKSISNFDELSVLENPNSVETWKMLLTSQFYTTRLAWRRDPQRFNLRCSFAGTTNKERFIPDPTLSRRLGVIELTGDQKINFGYLQDNKTKLWQEAVFLAQKGDPCVLTTDEQKQVEDHNIKYLVK